MATCKTGISGTLEYAMRMNRGGIACAFAGLGKARKRYVRDLVVLFGWSVRIAIQHAYAWPFDERVYDYRRGVPAMCTVNRKTGEIRRLAYVSR